MPRLGVNVTTAPYRPGAPRGGDFPIVRVVEDGPDGVLAQRVFGLHRVTEAEAPESACRWNTQGLNGSAPHLRHGEGPLVRQVAEVHPGRRLAFHVDAGFERPLRARAGTRTWRQPVPPSPPALPSPRPSHPRALLPPFPPASAGPRPHLPRRSAHRSPAPRPPPAGRPAGRDVSDGRPSGPTPSRPTPGASTVPGTTWLSSSASFTHKP